LITTYSEWYILLCILIGMVYAAVLYYWQKKTEFSISAKWFMAILRGLVVTIIAFLLLEPLLKSKSRYSEPPVVVLAQDNSQSILSVKDSLFYKNKYPEELSEFVNQLNSEYNVELLTFGDQLKEGLNPDFSGKITDYSELFETIEQRYSNRNVGALILASDGIYNRGANPLYATTELTFPVFTLALGDTTIRRDQILNKVNYNRLAYLGNEFPVEAMVHARKCKGQSSEIVIIKDGVILERRQLDYSSDNYFETVRFQLTANESGLQRYRVEIRQMEGEISKVNNREDIFIDILEGRQKILILYNAAHPDITGLKSAILSNKNYTVDDFLADEFQGEIAAYNLLILHGLPSLRNPIQSILQTSITKKTPILFVLTPQVNFPLLNEIDAGMQVTGDPIIFNESTPVYNDNFTAFNLSDKTLKTAESFSPLISSYANFLIQQQADFLFYQQIGSVVTQDPLYLFTSVNEVRNGFINGEGLWKWRLKDYLLNDNYLAFNEIINKTIQYLSLKVDKSYFRIFGKNNFVENEDVGFDAELYNSSYELINEPEIVLEINNEEGRRYEFNFGKTSRAYHLNAGILPPGQYTYRSSVLIMDKLFTESGEFTISPLNIEMVNSIANHQLLFNLAQSKGGEMYYPDQMNELAEKLKRSENIKPVVYIRSQHTKLMNFQWVLYLIIALAGLEWFIRKRSGSY